MCLLMYMIIMMYVIGICMHILLIGLQEYVDIWHGLLKPSMLTIAMHLGTAGTVE